MILLLKVGSQAHDNHIWLGLVSLLIRVFATLAAEHMAVSSLVEV